MDECALAGIECYESGTTILKSSVAACQNEQGGYSCVCKDGYELADGSDKQ